MIKKKLGILLLSFGMAFSGTVLTSCSDNDELMRDSDIMTFDNDTSSCQIDINSLNANEFQSLRNQTRSVTDNSVMVRVAGLQETPGDITGSTINITSPLTGTFYIYGSKSEVVGVPFFITEDNKVLLHFEIKHPRCSYTSSGANQHTLWVTNSFNYEKGIKITGSYIFHDEIPIKSTGTTTITVSLKP